VRIFEVNYETDGRTIKEPGVTETVIKNVVSYYGADSFDEVWAAIEDVRNDPEKSFKGLREIIMSCSAVGYARTSATEQSK
jgi:hypothetical protein